MAHFTQVQGYNSTRYIAQVTPNLLQVVWRESRELNCGYHYDQETRHHVVCQYQPRGNWINNASVNVGRLKEGLDLELISEMRATRLGKIREGGQVVDEVDYTDQTDPTQGEGRRASQNEGGGYGWLLVIGLLVLAGLVVLVAGYVWVHRYQKQFVGSD